MKRLLSSTISYLPAVAIPAIVGLASLLLFTKTLTASDYGLYSLVQATIALLLALSGWVTIAVVRYYPIYLSDDRLPEFWEP